MKKKEWWKVIAFLPIVIVAVIGIYFLVPKHSSVPLSVSLEDINLTVDEQTTISVKLSNPNAICTFKIDNQTVAKVEGRNIIACSAGETVLSVSAKYGSETATARCKVKVTAKTVSPPEPEEDNKDDNKDDPIIKYGLTKFKLLNLENIEYKDGKIYITNGKEGTFEVRGETKEEIKITSDKPLEISESYFLPNVYVINATEEGQFVLTFTQDTVVESVLLIVV